MSNQDVDEVGATDLASTLSVFTLYQDPTAAVGWLSEALDFTVANQFEDDGVIIHAELRRGDAVVIIEKAAPGQLPPEPVDGATVRAPYLSVSSEDVIDRLHARATSLVVCLLNRSPFSGAWARTPLRSPRSRYDPVSLLRRPDDPRTPTQLNSNLFKRHTTRSDVAAHSEPHEVGKLPLRTAGSPGASVVVRHLRAGTELVTDFSNRRRTSRCRYARVGRPGRVRGSPPGAGLAAIGIRGARRHRFPGSEPPPAPP